jgi:hypothetical protein
MQIVETGGLVRVAFPLVEICFTQSQVLEGRSMSLCTYTPCR